MRTVFLLGPLLCCSVGVTLFILCKRRLVTKVDNISAFKSLIDFDCPAKLS
ncbi:hypothetical protein V9T40_000909 [Parthenolecanium corni]|uniref:Uncharacterized protein n=1 Tax=Parthenolecanium corni TaxID=536013 RepID=A0AAN9TCI0_9HEMI